MKHVRILDKMQSANYVLWEAINNWRLEGEEERGEAFPDRNFEKLHLFYVTVT